MNDISIEPRLEELKKEFNLYKLKKMQELEQPNIVDCKEKREVSPKEKRDSSPKEKRDSSS